MGSKKILLTIDDELLKKAKAKAKKICSKSVQDYIIYLIQRDLFVRRGGGRPKTISADEAYMNKFSTATKKSKKIEKEIGGV